MHNQWYDISCATLYFIFLRLKPEIGSEWIFLTDSVLMTLEGSVPVPKHQYEKGKYRSLHVRYLC